MPDLSRRAVLSGAATSLAAASLAFAGFSGAMAIMRFSGDAIRDRLGAVATFRVSCIVAGLLFLVLSVVLQVVTR